MSSLQRTVQWLLYLAAVIAVAPVLPFLPLWVLAFLGLSVAIGLLRSRIRWSRTTGRIAVLTIVIAVSFSLMQLSAEDVALPLVQILCLLLGARLASEKTPRNMLQTFVVALVLLASSSLLTLDMAYLAYLILLILILSSGLILICFIHVDPHIQLPPSLMKSLGFLLLLVPTTTLVLMLALFFVLPRTPTPLWNIVGQESTALAGMTDQVQPGSFSDLAASGDLAFRAEMDELPAPMLYWRGIVLDHLDDQTWRRSNQQVREQLLTDDSGSQEYVIYAEPTSERFLVTLDRTNRLQGIAHRLENDGVFLRQRQDRRRTTYRGVAHPDAVAVLEGNVDLYLALPSSLSPQLQHAAAELVGTDQGFSAQVERLEGFFLEQQLTYSAEDLPLSETPLATFLFESRRGYCEHFASAFAVMLRQMGVPARLVGGYLGGTYNQFGNFYQVTEDRAHVWVEALNDQGVWIRIDPSRLAVNAEEAFLASVAGSTYLQGLLDALFHSWTRRVLNYDLRQQFELFRQASDGLAGLRHLDISIFQIMLPVLLVVSIVAAAYLLRYRRGSAGLVQSYLRQVAACAGLEKVPPELGLYQLADLSGHPLCREFAQRYGAAFYCRKSLDPTDIRRLKQIVQQLRGQRLVIEVALPESLGDNRKPQKLDKAD